MVNLLTFRLRESLFAVNIENVKWIVSIDTIYPISMMHDYIIGEIRYGENISFLVCLEKVLKVGRCENEKEEKSAIVISIKEKEFAILVDEILYIKEIENYEYAYDKVSFMSEGDRVVEVLKEEFFHSFIDAPAFRADFTKEKEKLLKNQNLLRESTKKDFLLFELDGAYFALESQLVQFVEVLEDCKKGAFKPDIDYIEGVYLVKKRLLKLINLKKLLHLPSTEIGNNILVLKEDGHYIGLSVDEIYNIESVDNEEISLSDEKGLVKEFFVKDKKIVSILNSQNLLEIARKDGIHSKDRSIEEKKSKSIVDLKEFLVISVGGTKYAISMEYVKEIHEEKDVYITRPLEKSEKIEGIATVGAKTFLVIDILSMLHIEQNSTNRMLLVLERVEEERSFEFAIFINDVDDIIHVAKEEVYLLAKQDRFISGTISQDDTIYNIINISWLIDYLKEKDEKGSYSR